MADLVQPIVRLGFSFIKNWIDFIFNTFDCSYRLNSLSSSTFNRILNLFCHRVTYNSFDLFAAGFRFK